MVRFGSARISENGTVSGQRGDQTGNEVSEQNGYIHKNGWRVVRAKRVEHANALAFGMKVCCRSDIVGYSQPDRLAVYQTNIQNGVPTNADCSSLVSYLVNQLDGVSVPAFATYTEVNDLVNTGAFVEVQFVSLEELYTGDILVDGKSNSHTVIVTEGQSREWAWITVPQPVLKFGSNGERVRLLQTFLNEYCNAHLRVDGDFGAKTKDAVLAFQAFWNLQTDGEYGEQTRNAFSFVMWLFMYQ